jgi:hypothetical protein
VKGGTEENTARKRERERVRTRFGRKPSKGHQGKRNMRIYFHGNRGK